MSGRDHVSSSCHLLFALFFIVLWKSSVACIPVQMFHDGSGWLVADRMQSRLKVIHNHLSSLKCSSKTYKYTVTGRFTEDQRDFYENNGYIVIKDLIPGHILDECKERFIGLCEGRIDKGGMTLMKDISYAKGGPAGQFKFNKVQDIVWDEVFSKYILFDDLLDIVENITGPNIMAMHSMLINKPPDSGSLTSRHPLHQDLHYFAFRPANKIVASWTAMERITQENGCLFVLPGTHTLPLLPHAYPKWEGGVNKGYHGIDGFDDHPKIALEMNKGDTVLFHPLLIHGSGPNHTKGFRKAISCHYAASECYYIDIEGSSQQIIADEVKAIARNRGLDMDYEEFWQFRNRLVRGTTVTL